MFDVSKLLAAIFSEWSRRLFAIATADPSSVLLYCSRAGLRLRILMECVCRRSGWPLPNSKNFMISRLLAAKVALPITPEIVVKIIAHDFQKLPISSAISAFGLNGFSQHYHEIPTTESGLLEFFTTDQGQAVTDEAKVQHALLAERLEFENKHRKGFILVDSGLFGSTQMFLSAAFPQWDWSGAYFGLSNYRNIDNQYHYKSQGLIFETDRWSPAVPETSFLRHWHLIESVLEPNLPSVRAYRAAIPFPVSDLEGDCRWPASMFERSGLWDRILTAIEKACPLSPDVEVFNYREAINELCRMILAPRPQEISSLDPGLRSHDFGRNGRVPVLLNGKKSFSESMRRIRKALWSEGQIVTEFGILASFMLDIRRRVLSHLKRG